MIFLGFLNFLDQIKPDAVAAIATLHNYGIEVKILTGDNEQTTLAVCKQINLQVENVLYGNNIDQMDDSSLKDEIEKANIFVKLSPLQKNRIIRLYKANNHQVGFMGDGINDAIALKTSDVAISVNNGAEITKEVSDIILLEKSLNVLEKGIFHGRNVYVNIIKYLKITINCNLALMLSLVIGTLMFSFSPMSVIQILMQNLVYDILNAVVVFDNNDNDWYKTDSNWNIKGMFRFGWWNFLWIVIISVINFIIVRYYLFADFNRLSQLQIQQVQTTFFLESSLIHMLSILVFRTKKIAFFNRPLAIL